MGGAWSTGAEMRRRHFGGGEREMISGGVKSGGEEVSVSSDILYIIFEKEGKNHVFRTFVPWN